MVEDGMTTIPVELYDELHRKADLYDALQAAGVDNWEGIDLAIEIYEAFKKG